MGRELIRVPPGFVHPGLENDDPEPGAHLEPLYHMTATQKSAYQIYENVTEGTPVSPVLATLEELAAWLRARGNPEESIRNFITDGHAPSLILDGSSPPRDGISP